MKLYKSSADTIRFIEDGDEGSLQFRNTDGSWGPDSIPMLRADPVTVMREIADDAARNAGARLR